MAKTLVLTITDSFQQDCLEEALEEYLQGGDTDAPWYYEIKTLLDQLKEQ